MSLFVFSQFFIVIVLCQAEHETCGVFPKDPIIKMGSEIQIMFSSPQDSFCRSVPFYSPHKLIWKLNDKKIAEDFYIVNSTMSAVTIRSSGMVTCHMHLGERDVILGGTNITVLLPPVKPTKIHCKLFALTKFTCYWNSGNNTVPGTEYTVYGRFESRSRIITESCMSKTDHCTFKNPICDTVNITVKAQNAVGSVESDIVRIDINNVLKLLPPEVTVKPLLNKLQVHWKMQHVPAYPESHIICELLYQYENISESKRAKLGGAEIVMERLCVNYTVSMRCAPETSKYWSDWSPNVTVFSPLDVKAVKIYLWRKIDTPDGRGFRRVLLMWKGVLPSCNIDGYNVTVRNLHNEDSRELWFNILDSNTSLVLDGKMYRISIAVSKNNNTSPEVFITIPAIGEDRPPVKELQAFPEHSQLYVTWAPPQLPVDHYMVEWSTGDDVIEWHESQSTSTSLIGQPFKLYRITVSPVCDTWPGQEATLLAYFKEGAPGNISVKVTDIQDRRAHVSWTSVPRSQCCGFVRNYTVFYKSETGPEFGVTVNSSVEEVFLEDLDPSKNYKVHVMASSAGGTTNSTLNVITTQRYGTTFLKMLGVLGGFGLILVITVCLCCVVLMNKYFTNVPSPKFSTLALWLNEPLQDKMQHNTSTPSAESYFHNLEIHPYGFDSMIMEISPSPLETLAGQNEEPHPVFEHMKVGVVAPVRASAVPSLFVGPSQTCGHSAESDDGRTAGSTPASQEPRDCNSTIPCWGNLLGKNGYVGEEALLPPSKEMQPFLEPPKNTPQAYVTLDLLGQSANG
ncbi:interleukin-31 receptor subunit alpha-like [Brienomyrus brachyistius]|uniref:interleukin-31 receptor subunit alpha-like n=1 Tax=Brienomyrus brachyistius TaxID=42636 RepID=UPI0020B26244|nr:interleukin-31 receptor subunit alpha-like [Brienomyrus brachyistius]XP_048875274.1 interleukin-31 receptor subunit alpha-like [Brienomyrus brachyistius]